MSNHEESFVVEIIDVQDFLEIDREKVERVCNRIAVDFKIETGRFGVVFVDDETIRQYNRDFLQHDYPTDVISFQIEDRRDEGHLEGEILACTQVARERAEEFGWTPEEEILLYVVHGILHLVGFDDTTSEQRREMRLKEKEYLAILDVDVPDWDCDVEL